MTPEEALDKATELLLSKEYEPIVIKALTNAKDVATGAATLVYPIIFRLMQETDLPDDELMGSEEGDGIAIHLLAEVFDIAAKGGLIEDQADPEPDGMQEPNESTEPPEQVSQEQAMATEYEPDGVQEPDESQEPPEQVNAEARAMAQKAVEILGDLLAQANGAMQQAGARAPQPPAPQHRGLLGVA